MIISETESEESSFCFMISLCYFVSKVHKLHKVHQKYIA